MAIALLMEGAAATAGSSPSGWTPLPDPSAGFVPDHKLAGDQALLDESLAQFGAELARAMAEQRVKRQQACNVSSSSRLSAERRADWHASCGYRRY